MPRHDFTADWTVEQDGRAPVAVHLPHDAMIHERRRPDTANGKNSGYFPGGRYTYRKRFDAPNAWRGQHVSLLIEGAYHRSQIELNGQPVGGRPSGYSEFYCDLDAALACGASNELTITVDTSDEPNSRWYSGSGLYRPVWLDVAPATRIARDGVRFRTVSIGEIAQAIVEVTVEDPDAAALTVSVDLLADDACFAHASAAASDGTALVLDVPAAKTWSADTPFLYDLVVRLSAGETVIDERRERVGLRTLAVDAVHGLRVNGVATKLRGGCLHHDSGILGAATLPDAEWRRARLIKQAGFNAIRSGHSPISRALLNACDAVGLYVIDELTDVWFAPKTRHDYYRDFHEWWRADLDGMIAKCRNHSSVIAYSLGNENSETHGAEGIAIGREMADRCRAADPTRFVTTGVNLMLNGLATFGIGVFDPDKPAKAGKQQGAVGSAFFNMLIGRVGPILNSAGRLRRVDKATEGIFATLDIAGYNYGTRSYVKSHKRHPSRVMFGSETLPGDLAETWPRILKLPYVIGDFLWTAQDYLGEAGIAGWSYDPKKPTLAGNYPWIASGGGAIDLIGTPGAVALHAQAIWGLATAPAIVVRPLDLVGQKVLRSPWRSTDAIPSWSWTGYEGRTTQVTVYSDADRVELRLNGHLLGTRRAGAKHGYAATFDVAYAPGELLAIALRRDRTEQGRSVLRSAGADLATTLRVDRAALTANGQDLAFVEIVIADADGIVAPISGAIVRVTLDGAATPAGLGSADPAPLGRYDDITTTTYQGRALAVLRAGGTAGDATLTVEVEGYGRRTVTIPVAAPT